MDNANKPARAMTKKKISPPMFGIMFYKPFLISMLAVITSICAMTVNPNSFQGTDSERIEQALAVLKANGGGKLIITPREDADKRDFWLIDRAILLDSNTTVIIDDCTIKLSNQCRDNFFRSANCGIGIKVIQPLQNIHIIGIGNARLIGADNPRSTGDSAKKLGVRTYGTDAGKEGEHQNGDWRNIGVLMAHVSRFSVTGISIIDSHCWAMSFERCTWGKLSQLHFESRAFKMVNGNRITMLNQDGIDLRQGCHYIDIDTITGFTGDDLVALTTIGGGKSEPNTISSTMISGTKPTNDDDISHVTIRNIIGHSAGRCQIIRLLNSLGTKIHDIIISDVIDTSIPTERAIVTIRIGDSNPAWGGVTPLGDTYGIIINNIHSHSRECILIAGSLVDSTITNVINHNPDCGPITYGSGEQNVRNLTITAVKSLKELVPEVP